MKKERSDWISCTTPSSWEGEKKRMGFRLLPSVLERVVEGYFNMDTREKWLEVMSEKPVEKISGIGDKIQERLNNLNIFTIKELQNADPFMLKQEFKKVWSEWLLAVAWGYDEREVVTEYTEKSIGRSCTLSRDTKDWGVIKNTLIDLIKIVSYKVQLRGEIPKHINLKVRYSDFTGIARTKELHKQY